MEKRGRHRSRRPEGNSKSSGSSSPSTSTSNSPVPPSSPKPSHSSPPSSYRSYSHKSSSAPDRHSSDSHSTTPPSSSKRAQPPFSPSSSSRSHSHRSTPSSDIHNSDSHGKPTSSPKSSTHSHSEYRSSRNRPLNPSPSPSGHHRLDPSASREASTSTPHSSPSSESHSNSSHIGINGDSNSRTSPHSNSTHSKPKSSGSHHCEAEAEFSKSPKPSRPKLRKQSKPALRRPDQYVTLPYTFAFGLTRDFSAPPKRRKLTPDHIIPSRGAHSSTIFGAYLRGAGNSKEWRCPIKLTLEELFHGKRLRFRLTRHLLSSKKKQIILDIHVPSGCRPGTKIICPGVGHERKDGSLQDIIFLVEEVHHERFSRLQKNGDDLGMEVKLPWVKTLEKEKGQVRFRGIDGKNIAVKIDYPNDRHMQGTHVVVGAGMPIRQREGKVTRGDLIVRYVCGPSVLITLPDFILDGRL